MTTPTAKTLRMLWLANAVFVTGGAIYCAAHQFWWLAALNLANAGFCLFMRSRLRRYV